MPKKLYIQNIHTYLCPFIAIYIITGNSHIICNKVITGNKKLRFYLI